MAIFRDVKTGEISRIRLCKYCLDYKGQPKPIMPDDFLARKEKDGSYKCGVCVREDIDSVIIKANPNSAKSQAILKRRQREEAIDKLNRQLYERSRSTNRVGPSTDWNTHDKEREDLLKYLIKNIF